MRLIDQQKAIEAMSSVAVLDKSAARRILTQLPTIEATPVKHGRWETADDGDIYCSCCGDSWASRLERIVKVRFLYCPYCGTPMTEGAEE